MTKKFLLGKSPETLSERSVTLIISGSGFRISVKRVLGRWLLQCSSDDGEREEIEKAGEDVERICDCCNRGDWGRVTRPAARIEERNPGSGFCRLAGERERRSSWAVRVGSGPCFQLVDGGWSGLTGLQLTGVVSGRVVGGSRPVRPELTIVCNQPASAPPPPTTR